MVSKKEEFRKKLLESLFKDAKKKKTQECTSSCKPVKKEVKKKVKKVSTKKSTIKKVSSKRYYAQAHNNSRLHKANSRMHGGDNFIKDLQRAGKGLGLSMQHTFQSMSNLGKDLYCETEAVMNIGRELDLGYTKDCPFTKTKSWEWSKIKQ